MIWPGGSVSISTMADGGPDDIKVVGPRVVGLRVPLYPGARYWGVRFRPEAGGAVVGIPARKLRDAADFNGDAADFTGDAADLTGDAGDVSGDYRGQHWRCGR